MTAVVSHNGGASDLVLPVLELSSEVTSATEAIIYRHQLTPAWWQVLATVLDTAHTVPDIARRLNRTRQSVQRIADILVDNEWARWDANPKHRRSQLLASTLSGRQAAAELEGGLQDWADSVGEGLTVAEMDQFRSLLDRILHGSRDYRAQPLSEKGPDLEDHWGPNRRTRARVARCNGAARHVGPPQPGAAGILVRGPQSG